MHIMQVSFDPQTLRLTIIDMPQLEPGQMMNLPITFQEEALIMKRWSVRSQRFSNQHCLPHVQADNKGKLYAHFFSGRRHSYRVAAQPGETAGELIFDLKELTFHW